MTDQIKIGDKDSFDDFEASVATRHIGMPKKKSIKETVPFSNITYDFSDINGETYWEERELEYVFEITADDPEELEVLKSKFAGWVMGVKEQALHDPHIPDYHFLATYDDMKVDDDEGLEKTTLTVTFTAYPYKIADTPKMRGEYLSSNATKTFKVNNESDHPVAIFLRTPLNITLKVGDTQTVPFEPGDYDNLAIKVPPGETTIEVTNSGVGNSYVTVGFYEEVF